MSEHKNFVRMSVSGTPGTGTITLGSAASGYQSLASAYGANATVDVSITDGTAWEVARQCTYTHSGTTLTRGTLEASSTGVALNLTNLAVVTVTATADFGRRMESAALNHVAGTDANTTMAVGNLYVVDMSAWATADRTYTLPAVAAVGDRIGVLMSAGSASYEVVLTAASGDTLAGVAGGTEWSRLFIANEVVIMRCTAANSTWVVEQDGRIPWFAWMYKDSNTTISSGGGIPTKIGVNQISADNSGGGASISNSRIDCRRAGRVLMLGYASADTAVITAHQTRCRKNGSDFVAVSCDIAAYGNSNSLIQLGDVLAGDYLELWYYHASGVTRTYYGASGAASSSAFQVIEELR